MNPFIGEIAEIIPKISSEYSNRDVDALFNTHVDCQGIVVIEEDIPIALITRTKFYQKLGTLYGYNLYMGRSVKLLMNQDPLIVDYSTPINEVSELAMKRSESDLYDYIIVTQNNNFYGAVSVQNLLITLATIQSEMASRLNPLTGLPGNHIINDRLKQLFDYNQYTVLYIDLDQFKAYNDIYGFSKGDEVIQETASLLRRNLNPNSDFLGHIGGDDFLVILYHYDFQPICDQIIEEFDQLIRRFYIDEHIDQGFVVTENRMGHSEKIDIVSISIAVVSNQYKRHENKEEIVKIAANTKKRCKRLKNSCYYVDSCCFSV